jgi:ribosomal subunit interface protein
VDIIFRGRRTGVPDRFRDYATAKLGKIVKLDQKTISIDVEITLERNPRQSAQRERVELTVYSRGPVVRAEAAADDRFQAFDRAAAKLETHMRRACDRRKARKPGHAAPAEAAGAAAAGANAGPGSLPPPGPARDGGPDGVPPGPADDGGPGYWLDTEVQLEAVVPIPMEGDGPLVVREKFHNATPMSIDRALHEMELVGHDFFLFRDEASRLPSVVYRRRGYDYGVIRLVEEVPRQPGRSPVGVNQQVGENRVTR